jgi:hypothetical protein
VLCAALWRTGVLFVQAGPRYPHIKRAVNEFACRRLLTRRADVNRQGWAVIDSPAASRIRM